MNYRQFLPWALAALVGGLGLPQAEAATITYTTAVETSSWWTADNQYVLGDIIYVRSNATLTVEAGTVVRGKTDAGTPGSDNPGTLIVTRGSKLRALGTEQRPVIFTDMFDDNYAGGANANASYQSYQQLMGQWGGIAICGRAFIAKNTTNAPNPAASIQLEGISALGANGLYGGGDDDDDSGELHYVSIRYAGFGLAANNELNGLGLAAVGRETALDHIEIMNNKDDGFEFWGGTVNAKYLVCWNVGDDTFDIDEGFRGKLQFLFGVQGDAGGSAVGSGISDRGVEFDGGNAPDSSHPWGFYKVMNMTLVGKGQYGGDGANGTNSTYSFKDSNAAIYMRDNAGPQIRNCVFVDFGGFTVHLENEGGDGRTNVQTRFLTAYNGAGFSNTFHEAQVDGYQGEITHNIFYQFGKGFIPALSTNDLLADALSDNSAISQSVPSTNVFLLPSGANNITNSVALPIASLERQNSVGVALDHPFNVVKVVPLAANDAITSPVQAPLDGFFTPVKYYGAFSPTNNWLANWTAVWRLGLTDTTHVNPAAPVVGILVTNAVPEVSLATGAGVEYSLEGSYDLKHWSPMTNFFGDGSTKIFQIAGGLTNAAQYRVVIP